MKRIVLVALFLGICFRFVLAQDQFIQTTNMNVARAAHTATLLKNGRVLIFGGLSLDWQHFMPLATYDPATDSFSQLGDMSYAAVGEPKGVVLQDGRVLLSACCGGTYPYYYVFNPTDNLMEPIQTGYNGQHDATLTLLDDGRVLVAGGSDGVAQHELSTAELFVANVYKAIVQPPITADGSTTFKATRGVIPVKFSLTENGTATCDLPPAVISLARTADGTTEPVNEDLYSMPADDGSNFRVDLSACQYVYNLSSSIGVGVYRADISINGTVVGNAVFALK